MTIATATTEWIAAISSAIAAVGTVGAVVFALWQVRRQEKTRIDVTCGRALAPIGPGNQVHEFIRLEARHVRGAPLKLEMAFFENMRSERVVVSFLPTLTEPIPKILTSGETLSVAWAAELVAKAAAANGPFRAAFFRDAAGHDHRALFPGVRHRRAGLLRRRLSYVGPSEARTTPAVALDADQCSTRPNRARPTSRSARSR